MINMYNQVPTVYLDASRDFQYLSWLINIVLNSVKHNVDDLYDLPNVGADSKLSELLAFTLGFKVKRNYNKDQLLALVNIIPELLRNKGTQKAIELAGNALIKSSGAIGQCKVATDSVAQKELKNGIIKVVIPKDLVDLTLFYDLLPYILPAGLSCKIVRQTVETNSFETIVGYRNAIRAEVHREAYLDDTHKITGVSTLYDVPDFAEGEIKGPNFTNYDYTSGVKLNAGLLNNTIIPMLDRDDSGDIVEAIPKAKESTKTDGV